MSAFELFLGLNEERMEHLMDDVQLNGKWYYVSTLDTFDHGFETMVFECYDYEHTEELKHKDSGVDWSGLYSEAHDTPEAAAERHKYIVENLDKFINKGE